MNHHHSIDLILLEMLAIVQWFNPFVWPYKESLKETHEYLADNAVIARGCDTAKYQLLIFEQHVGVKLFEFANNFNHSKIKRRITMISKIKSKRWMKCKTLLILPIFLFLVIAFADSNTVTTSDQTDQDSAENMMLVQDETSEMTQAEDKTKSEKKKEHEIQAKIAELETELKELKAKYAETKDEEIKKKIKEKAMKIKQYIEAIKAGKDVKLVKVPEVGSEEWNKMKKELKVLMTKTEDPDKLAKLKEKYKQMLKMEEEAKKKEAKKQKK